MRAVAVLSVCVILACAVVANAAVIPVYNVGADGVKGTGDDGTNIGTLTYTRGAVSGGYEQVDFNWTAWNAPYAGGVQNTLGGTFTITGGTMYLGGTASSFRGLTDNGDTSPAAAPQTWINMDGTVTAAGTFVRTGAGPTDYTALSGAWFVNPDLGNELRPNDTSADGWDQTLLARVFVTPGANITFNGAATFTATGTTPNINFTTIVPEPGTLALLACGAMGLLVFAWRRRK